MLNSHLGLCFQYLKWVFECVNKDNLPVCCLKINWSHFHMIVCVFTSCSLLGFFLKRQKKRKKKAAHSEGKIKSYSMSSLFIWIHICMTQKLLNLTHYRRLPKIHSGKFVICREHGMLGFRWLAPGAREPCVHTATQWRRAKTTSPRWVILAAWLPSSALLQRDPGWVIN